MRPYGTVTAGKGVYLWVCTICSSVVIDRDRHDGYHASRGDKAPQPFVEQALPCCCGPGNSHATADYNCPRHRPLGGAT